MSETIHTIFEFEISPEDRNFLDYFKAAHTGKENAIKGKDLSPNRKEKEIQLIMQRLREAGYPICACQQGYYYSENPDDIKKSLEAYRTKISAMDKVAYGMLKAYNRALEVQ
jgi:hypothetical protein